MTSCASSGVSTLVADPVRIVDYASLPWVYDADASTYRHSITLSTFPCTVVLMAANFVDNSHARLLTIHVPAQAPYIGARFKVVGAANTARNLSLLANQFKLVPLNAAYAALPSMTVENILNIAIEMYYIGNRVWSGFQLVELPFLRANIVTDAPLTDHDAWLADPDASRVSACEASLLRTFPTASKAAACSHHGAVAAISADACRALCARARDNTDVPLTVAELSACIGLAALATLPMPTAICVRSQTAPARVRFHVDDADHVTPRMTVLLNDDFVGGELVYVYGSTVHVLPRAAGEPRMHDSDTVHGVTALVRGRRTVLLLSF